jgi:hypothetical protein
MTEEITKQNPVQFEIHCLSNRMVSLYTVNEIKRSLSTSFFI